MIKQNIICANNIWLSNNICRICFIGKVLKVWEGKEFCEFNNGSTFKKCCSEFICDEQCEYCPDDCEFYEGEHNDQSLYIPK